MALAIVLAHGVPINAAVGSHHHMGSPTWSNSLTRKSRYGTSEQRCRHLGR